MQGRVLIVEDNPLIAIDLRDTIFRLGYPISGIASDFESARRLAPHSDLALVDVNLRDGETGPEIARYLAQEFDIAVALVTASPGTLGRGVPGVVGVVLKPVPTVVVQKLLAFLQCRRNREEGVPPTSLQLFTPD